MKIDIKKVALINIIATLIIIICIILQDIYQGEYHSYRRLRSILGYFGILHSFIISVITTIIIVKYYYSVRFQKPLKFLYLLLPSLIILFYFLFMLIYALIISIIN